MSYENAPATEMVATYCACCGRPLVDAVSVETGVGPECRKRHGFDDSQGPADWGRAFASIAELPEEIKQAVAIACAEMNQRRAANVLVHFIAVHQDDRLAVAATEAVSHLGFTKLAERIAKRVGCVRIEQEGDELLVRTPYSDDFNASMRRVPGARWDREAKARRVPVESKRALWVAMQRAFAGCMVVSAKGAARIGEAA